MTEKKRFRNIILFNGPLILLPGYHEMDLKESMI